MNWIDVNEQLPPDNNSFGGKLYLVSVTCRTWKQPQTMVMEWQCKTIRNKEVRRWLWNNSIKEDAWFVTHWMELPKPCQS